MRAMATQSSLLRGHARERFLPRILSRTASEVMPTMVHCPGRARGNPPYRGGDEHLNPNRGLTESDNSESVY